MVKLYSKSIDVTSKILNLCVKLRLWKVARIILDLRKKYIVIKLRKKLSYEKTNTTGND
jgi:hypothetical protein